MANEKFFYLSFIIFHLPFKAGDLGNQKKGAIAMIAPFDTK
jgi:hypothetical protein